MAIGSTGYDPAAIGGYIAGGMTNALAVYQYHKGRKMQKGNVRPTYNIPEEITANLTDAQRMALEGLPAEQKQQFINNIQRSQNFGLSALSDRKAGLSGLGSLVQNTTDAYSNLLTQDAAARMQNQQSLMNARGQMAQYKDQAFELNKLNPYYEKEAAAQALMGAGMQNFVKAHQTAAQGMGGGVQNPSGGADTNPEEGARRKKKKSEDYEEFGGDTKGLGDFGEYSQYASFG